MISCSELLTYVLFHLYYRYDPITGFFYRKDGTRLLGCKVLCDGKWYWQYNLGRFGKHWGHRLAFLAMGEPMPEKADHLDHDGLNNSWCNLRASDSVRNRWNLRVPEGHPTGHIGISRRYNKDGTIRYHGEIKSKLHERFSKTFRTLPEAVGWITWITWQVRAAHLERRAA